MSLSFPVNPSTGTTYQNWVYDASRGSWQPNFGAQFVTSFGGRVGPVTLQTGDNTVGNRVLLMSSIVAPAAPVASVSMFYNFTNQYDIYEVEIYDFQVSAGGNLGWNASTDGSTWNISTAAYAWAGGYAVGTTASGGFGGSVSSGYGVLSVCPDPTQPAAVADLVARFHMPWTTDRYKHAFSTTGTYAPSQGFLAGFYGSFFASTAPLKGLRFLPTAGNITRGVFNLYGLPKAGAGGS